MCSACSSSQARTSPREVASAAWTFPRGASENGAGTGEFILPSGVVLTSFDPSFVPVVGYQERIGRSEEDHNNYEPRVYPDDFYEGITESAFGGATPYPVQVKITAPEDYAFNSVGVLASETVADGKRTSVWKSDHPVSFFNVIGARWSVWRGEGTAIFYLSVLVLPELLLFAGLIVWWRRE